MKQERGVKRPATTDKGAAARKKRAVQNEDSRPAQKSRSTKRNLPPVEDDSNTDVSEDSEGSLEVDDDIEQDQEEVEEVEGAEAKDPERRVFVCLLSDCTL